MTQPTEKPTGSKLIWVIVIGAIFSATCFPALVGSHEVATSQDQSWKSLITPEQLHVRAQRPNLLVLDARSPEEYAAGHIPGAINLPGSQWRTPPSKDPAADGPGQRLFRRADGSLDIPRYEALLGRAGITAEHEIVVYGNHAGKADGSVPAAILVKLGHQNVSFLDGVGLDRWRQAGFPISQEPRVLPAAAYVAKPRGNSVWSAEELLQNLNNDEVVIIDSRTEAEYRGADLRGNRRGGHIPGARLLNSEEFLNPADQTTISLDEARQKVERLIPRGKTVVVYCQSGTRCSHEELLLRDLGFENVILYDASWQEWGNRADTPIAAEPTAAAPQAPSSEVSP